MNKLIRELAEQARDYVRKHVAECKHYGYYMEHNEYELQFEEKFVELILIEVIATIYGSDIKDKKQDKLVDKLLNKFGMTQTEVKNEQ